MSINLMLGDCLERMREIPDGSVDMVLCDLPYGTTDCKWDSTIPMDLLWEQYKRVLTKVGVVVLFGSQPFSSVLVNSNLKMYKHSWVWNKKIAGNFATARYAPMKIHEDLLVFAMSKTPYYPIKTLRDVPIKMGANKGASQSAALKGGAKEEYNGKVYDDKFPESILVYGRERGLHPTQKPVALCEYLVKTYTTEGQVVLDNCMGSGTTGVACKNTNRNFIGIEMDEGYFNIAKERINAAQDAKAANKIA